jgi:hypothetical protein
MSMLAQRSDPEITPERLAQMTQAELTQLYWHLVGRNYLGTHEPMRMVVRELMNRGIVQETRE